MSKAREGRAALARRDGERFRVEAEVERFGTKPGWNGGTEQTVLLRNVIDAASGQPLTDHLWFKAGKWCSALHPGARVSFEARVSSYLKGYLGRREVFDAPVRVDWRLERPTKLEVLDRSARTRCEVHLLPEGA